MHRSSHQKAAASPRAVFALLLLPAAVTVLVCLAGRPAWAGQEQALVAPGDLTTLDELNGQEFAALSDEELDQVSAGDLQMSLEDFDVMIHGNEAGLFTMDIATSAFQNAQGVFTTLQAVNSAVDLTVVVNIFFNQSP